MGKHPLLAFTNPAAGREADCSRRYDERAALSCKLDWIDSSYRN
jgi:hypothetical protein